MGFFDVFLSLFSTFFDILPIKMQEWAPAHEASFAHSERKARRNPMYRFWLCLAAKNSARQKQKSIHRLQRVGCSWLTSRKQTKNCRSGLPRRAFFAIFVIFWKKSHDREKATNFYPRHSNFRDRHLRNDHSAHAWSVSCRSAQPKQATVDHPRDFFSIVARV